MEQQIHSYTQWSKHTDKAKLTWFGVGPEGFAVGSKVSSTRTKTSKHNHISVSRLSLVCCRSAWRWLVWLKRWPGRRLRWPLDRWPVRDSPSNSHWGVKNCWRSLKPSKAFRGREKVCVFGHFCTLYFGVVQSCDNACPLWPGWQCHKTRRAKWITVKSQSKNVYGCSSVRNFLEILCRTLNPFSPFA